MPSQECPNRKYTERARERMAAMGLPQLSDAVTKPITAFGEDAAIVYVPDLERRFEEDMAAVYADLRQRREAEIIASGGSITEDD
jgi:hypothetical protein